MKRLVVAALAVVLTACGPKTSLDGEQVPVGNGSVPGRFVRIDIDGMPCIVWVDEHGEGSSSWSNSGITCDWRDR